MYGQQHQHPGPGAGPGFGQPPMGPSAAGPYGPGPTEPNEQEKTFALIAHLSPFVLGFLGPLIFMLVDVTGQPSAFVKHNAKQALVWSLALVVVSIFTCGLGGLVMAIWHVIGALQAHKGTWYTYPGCARFADN